MLGLHRLMGRAARELLPSPKQRAAPSCDTSLRAALGRGAPSCVTELPAPAVMQGLCHQAAVVHSICCMLDHISEKLTVSME